MLNGREATPNCAQATATAAVVANTLIKFVTGPDLSDAAPEIDRPDEVGVETCGAAEEWAGVALNDAEIGEVVNYQFGGIAQVLASGVITHTTVVTSDAAGKLVGGATNRLGILLMDADALDNVVPVMIRTI
jgi:hypothetical protein